jgi:hypothetical protein
LKFGKKDVVYNRLGLSDLAHALKNISEIAKRINKNIESSNEIKIASHPGGLANLQ